MPQLQINQGPQDALLYDNTRSYFTNVGYVRTSNFQVELRDIEAQNNANLGSTAQYVIPKAADLLGPLDLIAEFNPADTESLPNDCHAAWVETIGYAMLEKITFSIGSNDVETIEGDHLNIINELMRSETQRHGKTIGKTGRAASSHHLTADAVHTKLLDKGSDETRLIASKDGSSGTIESGLKLIIPLGLFFTKHPSQYFPLAAIAGCNDVRVTIKFRSLKELLVVGQHGLPVDSTAKSFTVATNHDSTLSTSQIAFPSGGALKTAKLRAHYVHVTGPEATQLMNKEHVRLMKMWSSPGPNVLEAKANTSGEFNIDLSFLHPVQELIITIRKQSDLTSEESGTIAMQDTNNQKAVGKNRFAYHGSGRNPNVEAYENRLGSTHTGVGALQYGGVSAELNKETIKVKSFKLTLNGQDRHPSLSDGLDRNYLMDRMMPMLHSNTATDFEGISRGSFTDGAEPDFFHLAQMKDRKEIYVYPFALNPEGANPSGAVNFSKVSHAKLNIKYDAVQLTANTYFQVDVYGIYYNWLQIKDGRALLSFA